MLSYKYAGSKRVIGNALRVWYQKDGIAVRNDTILTLVVWLDCLVEMLGSTV